MSPDLYVSERWLSHAMRLVVLRGELDGATTPRLAVILRKAVSRMRPVVVVDISEVTTLGPVALALLHHAQVRAAKSGGCVTLVSGELRAPPAFISAERSASRTRERRLATVVLAVFASREEAIAAARQSILNLRPQAVRSVLDVPVG